MFKGWIPRLLLLLATSAMILGVLELVVRQFLAVPPTWKEPQATHLESPLLGWVLPPGLEAFTIDAPVHVNSLGYRDDEFPRAKPDGEVRILGLGDSFTFALGVTFDDLWVQQLERSLQNAQPPRAFQVVNMGVAGYNTRQERISLETDGWSFDPDLVIVAFYWNDLVGNDKPLPDPATTPRIAPDSPAWERGSRAASHALPSSIRDRLRQSVFLYNLVIRTKNVLASQREPTDPYSLVQKALLEGDEVFLEPYWKGVETHLLAMAAAARQRGIPMILLHFPDENAVRGKAVGASSGPRLGKIWAKTGFPYVDVTEAYVQSLDAGRNPFLPYDLHPNATGMMIASDALREVIDRLGYLAEGDDRGVGEEAQRTPPEGRP